MTNEGCAEVVLVADEDCVAEPEGQEPPHLSMGLLTTPVGSVGAAVVASANRADSRTYLESIVEVRKQCMYGEISEWEVSMQD